MTVALSWLERAYMLAAAGLCIVPAEHRIDSRRSD